MKEEPIVVKVFGVEWSTEEAPAEVILSRLIKQLRYHERWIQFWTAWALVLSAIGIIAGFWIWATLVGGAWMIWDFMKWRRLHYDYIPAIWNRVDWKRVNELAEKDECNQLHSR